MADALTRAPLADHLDAFLDQAMRTPFADGAHDCLLFPADWVRLQRGVDPAAGYRGRYRTWRGGQRLLKRAGGAEAVVTTSMAAAGLEPITDPRRGDVGLIRVISPRGLSLVGGLFTGRRWGVLATRGLLFEDVDALIAWRV